ncbi:MAG: hypothetical protein AB7N76_20675 [Planctomycetota bacterium]
MSVILDHVALLVRDLDACAARPELAGLARGEIDEFPAEGTRELYVDAPADAAPGGARLLLMQALGEVGPYARALARRGPGLHHLALRVSSFDDFLGGLQGWLLHPASLRTREHGALWLARPGVSTLVEVCEGPPDPPRGPVRGLEVAADAPLRGLLAGLGCAGLAGGEATRLRLLGDPFDPVAFGR